MRQASIHWQVYGVFAFCVSLFLLPFMSCVALGSDEGTLLCGAARIVQGQVFARDFFEVMGPGTFYWLAAFFKIFGISILAARVYLFLILLGTALSIYFLSRRVCARFHTLPCLILAGPYFGMAGRGVSYHLDSNFFALLATICLLLWHTRRTNGLIIAAGAMAGVTTCFLQPKGILLFLAFLTWLWLQRRRIAPPMLLIGLATAGFLGVLGVTLAYFWSRGALNSLVYVDFVFPARHYSGNNAVAYAYGIQEYWTVWTTGLGGSSWSVGIAAVLVVPFIFVAALPGLILILGTRYKWRCVTPGIALLWLSGWAIWLSEFHRKDIHHLIYGSPLLFVLCFQMLGEMRRKFVDLTVQILAICAVSLAGFNCLMVTIATHRSVTRVGSITMFESDRVLQSLDDHVAAGEDVLVYPYSPMYNFLSATVNPTPYFVMVYNYNTPSQFAEIVRILERRQVRYVVWDTNFVSKVTEKVFPGSKPTRVGQLIVEPYLESHYTTVQDDNGIRIMERKHE